jgi:hypothetical protein
LYCTSAGAPMTRVAWNDPASPFNGTLRAVNFKSFNLMNRGGYRTFCTDIFGRNPSALQTNGRCVNAHHVVQTASAIDNYASNGSNAAIKRCAPQANWVCGITGSTVNASVRSDGSFPTQGLGYELILDKRRYSSADGDPAILDGEKKVIYGEN